MHTDFAEWYRLVDLSPESDQLEKRWQAIESIIENFSKQKLLEVVRIASPDLISFAQTDETIQEFYQADSVFRKRDNTAELQVLAGSIIASVLSGTPSPKTTVIALATICSRFANKRNTTLIPDAYNEAEKYLRNEGQRVRSLTSLPAAAKVPDVEVNTKKVQEVSETLNTSAVTGTAIIGYGSAIVDEIKSVNGALKAAMAAIASRQRTLEVNQRVLNEEIEVSWWLLGEWNNELSQPYSEIAPAAACIIAAKELAGLTSLMPGPPASKHLLDKVLKSRREQEVFVPTLKHCVNALPHDWRIRFVEAYPAAGVGDLCPVSLAISKSLETDGDDEWVPAFTKATNLNPAEEIDSLALAYQTYLECLLIVALQ